MSVSDPERRTIAATPRHLKQLKEKGIVPRSALWAPALSILALPLAVTALVAALPSFLQYLAGALSLSPAGPTVAALAGALLALLMGPALVTAGLVALGSVSWRFPLRLQALSPLPNVPRIFSRASLYQAAMIVAALAALAVAWWGLWVQWASHLAFVAPMSAQAAERAWLARVGQVVIFLGAAGAALAAAAFFLARAAYRRQSNMTPEEFREDLKAGEGDPKVRARWAQLRFSFYAQRLRAQMKRADVVVVNPTHYAVALAYEPWRHQAPEVVASGKNALAQRIRELAEEYGIAMLSAPELARDLYHHVKVGDEIPARLYQAVANILAYLMKTYGYRPRTGPREESR
jgi:flagellar biosynthetic protein FlhB